MHGAILVVLPGVCALHSLVLYVRSQEEFAGIMAKEPGVLEPARQLVEALDYMKQEQTKSVRRGVMAQRYQVDKVIRNLLGGGHGRAVAKRVAAWLKESGDGGNTALVEQATFMRAATEAFDQNSVCVLGTVGDESADGLLAFFSEYCVGAIAESLEKRRADITKAVGKKGWKQAMVRFDATLPAEAPDGLPIALAHLDHQGATSWLLGLCANAFGFGPDTYPLMGFPHIMHAVNKDMVVHVYKVKPLIEQGLSIADAPTFMETPAGATWLKEHSVIFTLLEGQCAYIPGGFIPIITYHAAKEVETQTPMAFAMIHTLFCPEHLKQLDLNVWTSLATLNTKHLNTVKSSKAFTARAELVAEVIQEVAAARTA